MRAARDAGYCRRLSRLLEELMQARALGGSARVLDRLSRAHLLIIDDWGIAPLDEGQLDEDPEGGRPHVDPAPRCFAPICSPGGGDRNGRSRRSCSAVCADLTRSRADNGKLGLAITEGAGPVGAQQRVETGGISASGNAEVTLGEVK